MLYGSGQIIKNKTDMGTKNKAEFILLKKHPSGVELINTAHIKRFEIHNEITSVKMTEGGSFLLDHSLDEIVAMLANVVNKPKNDI